MEQTVLKFLFHRHVGRGVNDFGASAMVVLHCLCSVPMFHLVFWWFWISFILLVQIPVFNCIFGLLSHLVVAYGQENCCAWRTRFCVRGFVLLDEAAGNSIGLRANARGLSWDFLLLIHALGFSCWNLQVRLRAGNLKVMIEFRSFNGLEYKLVLQSSPKSLLW